MGRCEALMIFQAVTFVYYFCNKNGNRAVFVEPFASKSSVYSSVTKSVLFLFFPPGLQLKN